MWLGVVEVEGNFFSFCEAHNITPFLSENALKMLNPNDIIQYI